MGYESKVIIGFRNDKLDYENRKYYPCLDINNYKKPIEIFLTTAKENDHVIDQFLDALTNKDIDCASHYLSKKLKAVCELDIDGLKEMFKNDNQYKHLNKASIFEYHQNIRTNSILIINDEMKIINLYMIKEPDKHGNWKICGIEKEKFF